MEPRTAILAGHGLLPQEIAQADDTSVFVTFDGVDVDVPTGRIHISASFEKLGRLFRDLRANAVSEVVFAGAMTRPKLNPLKFDVTTAKLAPKVLKAMKGGDDGLLRVVLKLFEDEGFRVVAASEAAPALMVDPHLVVGRVPSEQERADALRALDILIAISPQDVAQSAVVAGGQCLGIETIQGTDAMLRFVADTPEGLKRGEKGVFVKAAKIDQDLRVDMPTIGPDTVRNVAGAGLAGLFIAAGGVIVLEQEEVFRLVRENNLFLIAR
ncbi:UDP-2,3-diacylglucosamine diphosphatase LpxI [Aliiroseovarius subalbicans]|uniref:LpxI family protein n=1 Tax=Aliiroseovarius subalbicans TaxID=2925840 RepID=UPI001F589742|nr:UDP-2,3-diacylglucosamine diphosphatase LpxI [Aliiroseovarius subalbicans]MCI2398373.1 UDP-2,3-diacylglucosamine diphosphatase LpxI [Aliiroseovarius subalbicans]